MTKEEKGQGLFEVVLALAVAALIMVAIVALATVSIRNASFSRNQSLATRYAQEAVEWLRGERDKDWDAFNAYAASGTWCLKELAFNDLGACSQSEVIAGTNFRREATLTIIDSANIDTEVKVYWEDAQGIHEVKTITTFTDWREQ